MSVLRLGTFEFSGFELPAKITYGGRQQLAVHTLIGGDRIIDTLGRDDNALVWSGVLSGAFAVDRARALDEMRVAASLVTLTWNTFCYSAVIAKLEFEFRSAWWITYKIQCAVYRDEAQSNTTYKPSLAGTIAEDLSAAGVLLQPAAAAVLNAALPLSGSSSQAYSAASILIANVRASVMLEFMTAENSLASSSLNDLVSATGAMASLSRADAYLSRASVNLALQAEA